MGDAHRFEDRLPQALLPLGGEQELLHELPGVFALAGDQGVRDVVAHDGGPFLPFLELERGISELILQCCNCLAGELTLELAADAFGSADLTVHATDAGGLFAEASFTVNIAAVNDAPTTTGIRQVQCRFKSINQRQR